MILLYYRKHVWVLPYIKLKAAQNEPSWNILGFTSKKNYSFKNIILNFCYKTCLTTRKSEP